jgi:hypothetical protein
LNAPGGRLSEAFIFKVQKKGTEKVASEGLRERLRVLAAGDRDFHFLARTMLASRLPWLHDIDREWAKDALIVRMSFNGSARENEVRALWQGYLWAPQLTPKLLEDLKPAFLQALTRELDLGRDDNLFYLFSDLLIKASDKLSQDEKQSVFRGMPIDGLVLCARYWRQILQGASESAANTWREKIGPLIDTYWPVVNAKVTPQTVEALALLAIQTREAFPHAFDILSTKNLLAPLARSGFIIRNLDPAQSDEGSPDHYDYAREHPLQTLKLIDQSIDFYGLPVDRTHLGAILDRAQRGDASVENTEEYRRLRQRTLS